MDSAEVMRIVGTCQALGIHQRLDSLFANVFGG